MGQAKSLIAGFLTGVAAAGSAVLLTTPKSGKEFRGDIQQKSNELRVSLRQFSDDLAVVRSQVNEVKQSIPIVKATASEIKDEIDKWSEDVAPHLKKLKSSIPTTKEQVDQIKQIQNDPR